MPLSSMRAPTTRRRFLKSAALGGGGVLAGAAGLNALSPRIWREPLPLDANESFWARSAAPRNPALRQDLVVDVAIVGGGLTGLSAAYFIRKASPGKRVIVLEAEGCGNGASGRNGAMVLTMTADRYLSFSADPQRDKAIYELTADNIRSLVGLAAATGIDCELDTPGALQVFNDEGAAEAAQRYVRRARSLGMPVEYWDSRQVKASIGSEVYRGGYFDPKGGQVHPMKLVRAFKFAAERAGAVIYENTRVEQVEEGKVHRLRTLEGLTVSAKSLVLASNAFTPNLKFLRNSILPLREYVAITRPLSDEELAAIGWQSRVPFNDDRTEVYYFGLTRDRRIHIGGGAPRYQFNNGAADPLRLEPERRQLERELARVFPRLAGVELEAIWQGVIDWSLDASPSVGRTGKHGNIFYALGYSGHGVNLTSVFGRIIADLEAGHEQAWTSYPFLNAHLDYVPNEPLRWAAVETGLAWYALTK
ncbi:MAG TPA: FAD-dependent oxidoreductase [Steroidobacteraceae bacterium]|nr:FAD-dependent oxidoreductase [Steroidobacteraceae bacterium]